MESRTRLEATINPPRYCCVVQSLKATLAAARLAKERTTQLKEKELRKVRSRKEQEELQRQHEQQRQEDRLVEQVSAEIHGSKTDPQQDRLIQRLNLQEARRAALQQQMQEREVARENAQKAFLQEKEDVDRVVAEMQVLFSCARGLQQRPAHPPQAEDRRKAENRRSKQQQLLKGIHTYLEQRAEWRSQEAKRAAMVGLLHRSSLVTMVAGDPTGTPTNQGVPGAAGGETAAATPSKAEGLMEEERAAGPLFTRCMQHAADHDKLLSKLTAEMEAKRQEVGLGSGSRPELCLPQREDMEEVLLELYREELEHKQEEEDRLREEKCVLAWSAVRDAPWFAGGAE